MKAQNRIWLIGGTQESADLARALTQQQISYVVSVTTESARNLYTDSYHESPATNGTCIN
jgi:precorrin-6A/cobalt-precorrin-6A reductase